MIDWQNLKVKKLDEKKLYTEALYIHLLHNGYSEDRAKLIVQKILNRAS